MKCAVIGATGYTGIELVKILLEHPYVEPVYLTTRNKKSIPIHELIPTLPKSVKLEVKNWSSKEIKKNAEIVFVCLPHTEALKAVKEYREARKLVIDLSADYRLKNKKDYLKWYGKAHTCPAQLKEAVYGLCELNRDKIRKADLIANPGCYPTGIILGVAPLVKAGLVKSENIVVDAKSGVSGAGKKLNAATQYAELDENFYAYRVNQHQHSPEILQGIQMFSGKKKASMNFVPHLLPIRRGILSVIYLDQAKKVTLQRIKKAYEIYDKESFVRVHKDGTFPALKDVQNTNFCDIGFTVDSQTNKVIVITAIDNLLKGASGQAVQNMNIRLGLPESEGILSL